MHYFPGYGWLTPIFDGRNARISPVAPVAAPGAPMVAPGGAPPPPGGPQAAAFAPASAPAAAPSGGVGAASKHQLRAPTGSPLAALANTGLGQHLGQILAQAPHLAGPGGFGGAGGSPVPLPPPIAGLPQMPPPPPGLLGGGLSGGLMAPTAPVAIPQWYLAQQQQAGATYGGQPGYPSYPWPYGYGAG